jgi:glycosyltransferase involved in cell wall biosynthesis
VLTAIPPETETLSDRSAIKWDGLLNVTHIHRKPFTAQFSIETLFANLRQQMELAGCKVETMIVPYCSKGILRRILNSWSAFRHHADIYHITGDIHYVAIFLPRDTTVLTIHDCWALERLTGLKRLLLKFFWFDLPLRRVKFVTVISEEAKRQLLRHVRVREDKVQVIPNIISPLYRPSLRYFNSACPRILHVGTTDNKNLSRLLEALRGLSCHLRIIGKLNDTQMQQVRSSTIDFSADYNLTEEQMVDNYREADLVSFTSTYEGFGLPILEANSVGRPVVTSNVSSMPEVAGDAACFVDPYDVDSIRKGIQRVIDEPHYREQLVQNGFKNAQRFSSYIIASKYLNLYRAIGAGSQHASIDHSGYGEKSVRACR